MSIRGLSLAGLIVAGALPAQAQTQTPVDPETRMEFIGRIRCAGASELCAWKRVPDVNGYSGFEATRPQRQRPTGPSDSLPSDNPR